jgi:hypothetical protein
MRTLVIGLALASLAAAESALPEAGGLTALPEPVLAAVPLANPGFEEDWAGWLPAKADAFSIVEGGHGGKSALRLDCGQAAKWTPGVRLPVKDASPGIYRLRLWVKTRDVGADGKGGAGARAGVEYLLAGDQRAWDSTDVFSGTRDWHEEELQFLLPPEIKPGSLAVSLHRYGSATKGEALFDDVRLERFVPPPVEAFLLYPNYRGFLPADGPPRVRLWVRVNEAPAKEPGRVQVKSADGARTPADVKLDPSTNPQIIEIDAAAWPAGRYLVQASLGSFRHPAYAVQKITADERRRFPVWFDARGVLFLQGKPALPIGLYNTTVKFPTVDEGEMARLAKMAEAPVNFNINYFVWANNTADRRRYLAEMQKHGIWFLDTVNNVFPSAGQPWDFPISRELAPEAGGRLATQDAADRYLTRVAGAMRDMPGHAGWYVMDERPFGHVPRHFHQYDVLRRADPTHPTYGVSNRPDELACWRDTLDVIGLDPYPLFNMKAGHPLSLVGDWTRAGVEATQGARPVWMVLQFFQGWSTDRWPTEEELRTMSLMAVTEGARGLFYWSFGSRALLSVRESEREGYWQRLVKVTKELKSIEPALLGDDAPGAVKAVSDPRVRWRARAADGKCYVFAYLPAEKFVSDPAAAQPVEVRFQMADGQAVTRTLRPDSADWFAAPAAKP